MIMTAGGWGVTGRPHSPSEIKQFLLDIQSPVPIDLWVPDLMDFLHHHLDDLDPTYVDLKIPPCSYIQYQKAQTGAIPSNFVAIGNAVMAVNPVFGQGMAKACIGAVTLDRFLGCLRKGKSIPTNFSKRFFALQAARIDGIWYVILCRAFSLTNSVFDV